MALQDFDSIKTGCNFHPKLFIFGAFQVAWVQIDVGSDLYQAYVYYGQGTVLKFEKKSKLQTRSPNFLNTKKKEIVHCPFFNRGKMKHLRFDVQHLFLPECTLRTFRT